MASTFDGFAQVCIRVKGSICGALYLEYCVAYYRAVSDVLTNLKGIATEMGSELDRQNNQIDRLGNKMDANQVHLDRARQRVNKQL